MREISQIYQIGSPEWIAVMIDFEFRLFNNEKLFCEKYIKSQGFWMFEKISLSSDMVYVTWIEWDGQHLSNSWSLQEVLDWLDGLVKKEPIL